MNDSAMTDVCTLFQQNSDAGKHVHCAIFLHVAAIFNNDLTPVATQGTTGADVHILTNDYITGNGCLRMNKRGWMNDRLDAVELIKGHEAKLRRKPRRS